MSKMRILCRDRISDWLSSYLNKFNYDWPWKKMKEIPNLSNDDARYQFMIELFISASQYSRDIKSKINIEKEIGDEFIKNKDISFDFLKNNYDITDINIQIEKIVEAIKEKKESKEISNLIHESIPEVSIQNETLLFTCAFLQQSKISYKHLNVYTERYKDYFIKLLHEGDDKKPINFEICKLLLSCINNSWPNNYQEQYIIYEKLIQNNILLPNSIIQYLIENKDDKSLLYRYNILYLVMNT